MLEMPNSHAHYIGIKYDYVEGYCYHTIENVDNMLDLLADKGYKIQISFNLLDQYGITLKGEKFVMKDWQPLTYDKNKETKEPKTADNSDSDDDDELILIAEAEAEAVNLLLTLELEL